ncbi:MAG: 2-succinyl-5-enolpyruvyl-6-hydroxy-3-cyclohexene-1-carboxylic-acid synthase [Candidatus Latescibacteria bacterium]|jgi:2-succinyl-5-enolpyruvyl-6-hydroxy-3-cyclohexene-1-carboxylate synthase|nr:2-succinyl-5-enolpyruvyl-6-hydroxy-3-cyclohexene-1-carboxylic-acid synthase [Candidatus Latescibacterota bacterium]
MYANEKNIQIVVALLKKYGVQHVVVSPGGRSIPIIRSIESESFFSVYSITDERSAAYFAMGMAQSLKQPVAALCTSGTAVCNYLPAVTEAFYQKVPLVVLTGDRNPYYLDQMEIQMINQIHTFDNVTKKSVTLPVVKNNEDEWYCWRLVNEALLEMNHHGFGPVRINIPNDSGPCSVLKLPDTVALKKVLPTDPEDVWESYIQQLKAAKRILVICGQGPRYSAEDIENIEQFTRQYNCVISVEHLSNLNCSGCIRTYPVTEFFCKNDLSKLLPDLVITLGEHIAAGRIKSILRDHKGEFRHWCIDETGKVKDGFKSLTTIFECTPSIFFKQFAKKASETISNDGSYMNQWQAALKKIKYPEFPLCHMRVAQELAKALPDNSILHLAILSSIRWMQFWDIPKNIEVFANIGTLGTDGSLSSLLGQAAVTDKLCFLMIGDMSFFYDMNAVRIKHIGSNVRIVMINNSGGGEFDLGFRHKMKNIENNIIALNRTEAAGWIESLGFNYCAARKKQELVDGISMLVGESDRPVFFEVFTDMQRDTDTMIEFMVENSQQAGQGIKSAAKSILGNRGTEIVRSILNK